MFGRKKPETPRNESALTDHAPPLKLRSTATPPAPAPSAAPTNLVAPVQPRYEIPKRSTDTAPRPAASAVAQPARAEPSTPPAPPPSSVSEGKRLLVGRDIVLSGEITTCDQLVVEGRVEATLTDSRVIEIRETGYFKGTAEIDDAEIRGVYEGDLIVRNRLLIRATGKVTGHIRYGMLEVECGGQLSGDIQLIAASAQPEAAAASVGNGLAEEEPADDEPSLLDNEESWQMPARQ